MWVTVLADARWSGPYGIGRFSREMLSRFPRVDTLTQGPPLLHPLEPLWLSWEIARRRPKVFFSPAFGPPLYSTAPFVFTIHDLIHLKFYEGTSRVRRLYYQSVVRPATRRAFCVLTDSEHSRREVLEWTGLPEGRVRIGGIGVGPEFSPHGKRHQPGYPYLLYVGNHKPHKNLGRLLRAFAASGVAGEVQLLLSGEPDAGLPELAAELGLGGRVVFAGAIPDALLPAYYRGALALVFPSLYEGFGLPPLEAMACGVPVVASSATSIPEVVGEVAVLVDPFNTEEMSAAIGQVAADSALRERLVRGGLERAKRFGWDGIAARVWGVLAEAAGGPL